MDITQEQIEQLEKLFDGSANYSTQEINLEFCFNLAKNTEHLNDLKLKEMDDFDRIKSILIALHSQKFISEEHELLLANYFRDHFKKDFDWITKTFWNLNMDDESKNIVHEDLSLNKEKNQPQMIKIKLDGGTNKHTLTLEHDKEGNCINILSDKNEVVAILSIADVQNDNGYNKGEYFLNFNIINNSLALDKNCVHVLGQDSAKEYTMDEIAKALNVPVGELRIKKD